MYKILLCWRYLLTRFIALASVISVMLGVATMIVVNAVMDGFSSEMQDRIQGILADVTFQTRDLNKGFANYQWHREQIFQKAGDLIEEITPTVYTPGMLTYQIGGTGERVSFQVDIVGIDMLTQGNVSKIASYLQHPENRRQLSFNLHEGGYDSRGSGENGIIREQMDDAGWKHRRMVAARIKFQQGMNKFQQESSSDGPYDPFQGQIPQEETQAFDPAKKQHDGIIVGIGASMMLRESSTDPQTGEKIVKDDLALLPGDDVMLAFLTSDMSLRLQSDSFTVVDLYESKMAEYDQKLVFVPIEKLQKLRGMYDEASGGYTITQILIKAKPGVNINVLRDRLREFFPSELYSINTWRDDKVTLLDAIKVELAMLNVLLSLIFAVAGFGILAIFYMIVVEKQRDIGILKALGASSFGVMQIFLYYSFLLGFVGSALGLGAGLLFVRYIKEIAFLLSHILQRDVFSPEVYSFYEIPTIVNPVTVVYIIVGAILLAVASGVLPAIRAAKVHPVTTLRS